jgi:type I restriction enzyme S subunit
MSDAASNALDWEKVTLGELLQLSNGINAAKAAYGTGVPFANVLEVITHEWLIESDIPGRITVTPKMRKRYEVKPNDVLFNRTSETQEEVGLASLYVGSQSIVFGGFVLRGRPLTSKLTSGYAKYAFRSPLVRRQIVARGQGGIRSNIGQRDLKTVTLLLPSPEVQVEIAEKLDDVSRLVSVLERTILKREAVKLGTAQRLLAGRERLGGFNEPWVETALGSIGCCIRGVGYDPEADLSPHERPFTVRLLRSTNVQGARIDQADVQFVHERRVRGDQLLRTGDIVMCMANGSRSLVGKSAYFDERGSTRFTFGAFMGAFRTKPGMASPRFVAGLLQAHPFRSWLDVTLSGSSINNLRPSDVETFTSPMPGYEEQEEIAAVLSDLDSEIDTLRARLAKARAIKQGMMQQLLTGRTRLPVEGAAA